MNLMNLFDVSNDVYEVNKFIILIMLEISLCVMYYLEQQIVSRNEAWFVKIRKQITTEKRVTTSH